MAVVRTIWRQRWYTVPAILLAVLAAGYVYFEGPRSYEVSSSYAFANPQVPTEKEIDADPALLELNSDNPYLRSTDPNLIANVIITRLNSPQTEDRLTAAGIETEYAVSPGALGGGLVVTINATGDSPADAVAATTELGMLLESYLYEIQKVNDADDRFLFTALQVESPSDPAEQISSRLRTVIMVGAAGFVLVFAAISLGTWVEAAREKRRKDGATADEGPADEGPADDDRDAASGHDASGHDEPEEHGGRDIEDVELDAVYSTRDSELAQFR